MEISMFFKAEKKINCDYERLDKDNTLRECSDPDIQDILKKTVEQFQSAGITNPRLEAEVLLAHFLKIERIGLYCDWRKKISPSQVKGFQPLVWRRLKGEPMAYIIGVREFFSLEFMVSPAVLIPRPETEFVVEAALRYCFESSLLIDVGTGSGIIGICLAKNLYQVKIMAVDYSEQALRVALYNAHHHKVRQQISFLRSDMLSSFCPDSADGIVSNPPYIPNYELKNLSPEIYLFEPHPALDGGQQGMDCIKKLIEGAKRILKKGGRLIIEIGYGQKEAVVAECIKQGFSILEIIPDYAKIDRVIVGEKK